MYASTEKAVFKNRFQRFVCNVFHARSHVHGFVPDKGNRYGIVWDKWCSHCRRHWSFRGELGVVSVFSVMRRRRRKVVAGN